MKRATYKITALSAILLGACDIRPRVPDLAMPSDSVQALTQGTPLQGSLERVGAAHSEFVPQNPTALSGYGGASRRFLLPLFTKFGEVSFCLPYEKVFQPPKIKTAVFEILNESSAEVDLFFLISLDLVAVTADLTQKIHSAINDVIGGNVATLSNTLVLATHTHSGPAGLSENPLWSVFVCDQYNQPLTELYISLFKDTLRKALGGLKKIETIGIRETKIPNLLESRFEGMPANTVVSLLSFNAQDAKVPLALVRMAVHPTTYGARDRILTADLAAPLEHSMQSKFNADQVFLLQTEIGNMVANTSNRSNELWAQDIAQLLQSSAPEQVTQKRFFSTAAREVDLPSAQINFRSCGAASASSFVSLRILEELPTQAPLTFVKINEEINVFLPGEWTTSGAAEIKAAVVKKLSEGQTFKVYSLAHDYTGYHLSRSDYQRTALESCSSLYGENGSETFSNLLNQTAWPL